MIDRKVLFLIICLTIAYNYISNETSIILEKKNI